MRPVDKGQAPDVVLKKYQDAEPYLEKRIGPYCSFCELPIRHVPEMEHKEAKSQGGEELSWDNFLLSCKYCNARKGTTVKQGNLGNYLWPDTDDTFHAFDYEKELPCVAEAYLKKRNDGSYQRAQNLLSLVKLDHRPSLGSKDKRYFARNEARNYAGICKAGWNKMADQNDRQTYLKMIIMLAKASGFFSVWMSVFADDETVRTELLNSFEGTRKEFFDT